MKKKLLSFFNYFPKKYPNIKMIVKPHPTENINYWVRLLKKINCKNLVLADNKFTTNSYILASEFNIGSNCHTSLESYLSNKPTINLRASKKDGYIVSDLIRAVSGKEVLKLIELEKIIIDWFIKNKKFKNTLKKKELKILNFNIKNINKEFYYYFHDKIKNIKLLNDYIKDKYSNLLFLKIFEQIRRLKNIYYNFYSTKSKQLYQKKKFSNLTFDEFRNYTYIIFNILKINNKKYLVKEIYPGCFCIEKKN